MDMRARAGPFCLYIPHEFRKRARIDQREIPVSVVQKNRHGPVEPLCGHDQIRDLVAIHVLRDNLQPSGRSK